MTTTKKPTIDERMAEVRREIMLCAAPPDIAVAPSALINVAALLIIIARQERDEALALADALFQAGQRA